MTDTVTKLQSGAVDLLRELIAIPSFSKEEHQTADALSKFITRHGVANDRVGNNVFARNKYFDAEKMTVLLNSHHDTVRPNTAYTLDPFSPIEREGKLYGLGSNDAGGSLVALLAAFLHFYDLPDLKYNLIFAGTAEEEISGGEGIERLLPSLGPVSCAIVGEPTQMQMAVAEKGLLVLDCIAQGRAGHAARDEGDNAVYKAVRDITWLQGHRFEKVSPLLGPVKMSVTVIATENKAHNVVPSQCGFVVDVRINELYTFEEVLSEIRKHVTSEVKPRSLRMRSSMIAIDHPLVAAGLAEGRTYYGSPTTSDKALMPFPALKMGPGDSARSHTADEFIFVNEIFDGIELYIRLLKGILQ